MPFAEASNVVVGPNLGLVFLTALALGCVIGGVVTVAKGRLGWFAVGLLTGGLLWVLTAFLVATPESLWARKFYNDEKLARAAARLA